MAATFNFKILTPNHKELDDRVVSIIAPGEAGYLGILANHAPIITTLREGELTVKFEDRRELHYHIGGGILKVAKNEAVLLTESLSGGQGESSP